ncbi:MAG: extracellular solute-binding protein [Cyanobacteria bacterium]|nr:extracellular solute-binding protein [Cyanobacteriota bacterium]
MKRKWMLVGAVVLTVVMVASLGLVGCKTTTTTTAAAETTTAGNTTMAEATKETTAAAATTKEISGEITVWHGDSDEVAKITQDLITSSFNAEYPNIKVNYVLAPEPFQEKLLLSVPTGSGPDLFEWNHDWIGVLAQADVIAPIDGLISPELTAKYIESAVKAGEYKGKQYTLPISAEAVAFAYNKTLLGDKKVPVTSDELVQLMKEFKDAGLYGISFPMVPFLVSGFVHAFGGYLWDDNLGLGVNNARTKDAINWILKNFKPYMTKDASWDPQVALFPESKTPFAINGPWALGSWNDAKIDFGLSTIPKISAIDKDPMPYVGVKSIYMTKSCKNVEAAFAFMVWATTNKDRILNRATKLGYIPVLKEVLEVPEVKDNPNISVFAQEVALGRPMASGPEMTAVWDPMQNALNAIWSGVKDTSTALDDAQAEIQQKINKLKK